MSADPTDPKDLEREIGQRQDHLARTVDELAARVAPKELARRGAAEAQAKARGAIYDERGALRTERLAAVGGAVATVVGLLGAVSWRRHRKDRPVQAAPREATRRKDRQATTYREERHLRGDSHKASTYRKGPYRAGVRRGGPID